MNFKMVMDICNSSIPTAIFNQLDDIYTEVNKSVKISSSSASLLLLNVEDILGFA